MILVYFFTSFVFRKEHLCYLFGTQDPNQGREMNDIDLCEVIELSELLCQKISLLINCEQQDVSNLFENYWWDMFSIKGHVQEMKKLLGDI